MKRFLSVATIASLAVVALSFGTFAKPFDTTYKVDKDSDLGKAKCMVCHTTAKGGKLNPYGKDLMKELDAIKSKKLTADILKKVEGLDSDGDGTKNLAEIKAGTLPGAK